MRNFNKIFITLIVTIILIFAGVNLYFLSYDQQSTIRPYRVEISRLVLKIEENSVENIDLSEYDFVTNIEKYDNDANTFFETNSDYVIMEINDTFYRFDYINLTNSSDVQLLVAVNVILGIMSILIISVMIFIRLKILKPFETISDVPYELSRGNLSVPIKENKSRFFGKFVWGVDLLRENIEQQKQRELELQKDKKTLLLSISHDIKTPLSAIKLYSKALSKGLYNDTSKQSEIAECINSKADEIESFVSQIIRASSEDFLNLEVNQEEFYLSQLMSKISVYYNEKLDLIKTDFSIKEYDDCILNGDIDRSIEVLQNIIENAIKYGDGHTIEISISDEEDCKLITIKNSGCTLPEAELPHIFDSFWRGSNVENANGSGLGLYICREIMRKMGGEVYAQINNSFMLVTTVFVKAG